MNFEKEFLDSLLDREQALRYPGRDRRINRPGHSRVVAIENNSLRSHRKNQPDRWLTRGRALQSDKYPDQSHNHDPQGADQENNQDCGNEIESQDQLNQPAGQAVGRWSFRSSSKRGHWVRCLGPRSDSHRWQL